MLFWSRVFSSFLSVTPVFVAGSIIGGFSEILPRDTPVGMMIFFGGWALVVGIHAGLDGGDS